MATSLGAIRSTVFGRSMIRGLGVAVTVPTLAAFGDPSPAGLGSSVPRKDRKPMQLEWWGGAPPATGTSQRIDQIEVWNRRFPNLVVKYGANASTG